MALRRKRKKWQPHHAHGPADHHGHDGRPAERLAPLEEMAGFRRSQQAAGRKGEVDDTIRVDRNSVRLPEKFTEEERDAAATFRLDPVVAVLLAGALAFIAFIAWQITLMPEK